jgi:hypothetical protein
VKRVRTDQHDADIRKRARKIDNKRDIQAIFVKCSDINGGASTRKITRARARTAEMINVNGVRNHRHWAGRATGFGEV